MNNYANEMIVDMQGYLPHVASKYVFVFVR